jgi:bifunctional DNase/RNase
VGSFALVLGERDGNRRLPIIIGGFEAQAIALEIENIKPNRPMTHDLILTIAQTFDIGLKEVVISELKEGVFYSKLVMHLGDDEQEIDARPSDAIAIAVRYKAPIYTYESILSEAGIVIKESDPATSSREEEEEEKEEEEVAEEREERVGREKSQGKTPAEMSSLAKAQLVKKLTQQIEEAIAREDYERAARLRDEISKLDKR